MIKDFGRGEENTPGRDNWKSPILAKLNSYIREQIVDGLLGQQSMATTAANVQAKGNSYFAQ